MDIQITDEAVEWFKDELDLDEGDVVRFFPKYGGSSDFQDGFSIGMAVESARKPQVEVEKKNVAFQIDEQDVWFFKEQDLHIGLKNDDVKYSNEPIE